MSTSTSETARTLRHARMGEQVKVAGVTGSGPLRQRILDMGLTRGAQVCIRKVAPLGDPIEISVRGYKLSLRKAEASCVVLA